MNLETELETEKTRFVNRRFQISISVAVSISVFLSALCLPAEAQQSKKVPRIGYLSSVDPATDSIRAEPFRAALREVGYIEEQNIAIEYRYAAKKQIGLTIPPNLLARADRVIR